ncbi:flavodoxin family protein [Candidatus Desantisbacteria bacterium]|nr:flavodoxin family protein [Candidatus Desantisbacteria bacterium]
MMVDVLGISGSPRVGQTTDQLIYNILRASHCQHEFISLANKKILSCSSCLKCKNDNICKISDDWKPITEHILAAKVIVLGAPNYFGRMNALTHVFLERFYSFQHMGKMIVKGKYGVIAAVAGDNPEAVEKDIKSFFEEIGIIHIGTVKAFGDSNCYSCKYATKCRSGEILKKYGLKISADKVMIPCIEKQPEVLEKVREIGKIIHEAINV